MGVARFCGGVQFGIHASLLVYVKLHTPLLSCLEKDRFSDIDKLDQLLRNDTDNRQDNR
jgi:hypothetical protein